MAEEKVRIEFAPDQAVARLILAAPKANVVDRAMMDGLLRACDVLQARGGLHAVVLTSDGPHFSFGASVEEHLPEHIAATLTKLGTVLRSLAALPCPTIAAVRGQCLGGGLELVLACDLIVAEESAQLGLPEIKLGVFPPAGAALLPVRVGSGAAARMVLTGSSWSGKAAAEMGLVDRIAPGDGLDAYIQEWLEKDFLPRSAVALGYAARASRQRLLCALEQELPVLERMYLDELMSHADPVEGIRAFMEKRPPQWRVTADPAPSGAPS